MSKIPPTAYRESADAANLKTFTLNPGVLDSANQTIARLQTQMNFYSQIASAMAIPSWVPMILNQMEGDGSLLTHLANGDLLTSDTINVPSGIMAQYRPDLKAPFNFVDAGIVALTQFKDPAQWGSLVITDNLSAIDFFNKWNGLGEWELNPAQPPAYIWSGTSIYTSGKFGSDGNWNSDLVSGQIGVIPLMRALQLI